jgi:hypothetical protein
MAKPCARGVVTGGLLVRSGRIRVHFPLPAVDPLTRWQVASRRVIVCCDQA